MKNITIIGEQERKQNWEELEPIEQYRAHRYYEEYALANADQYERDEWEEGAKALRAYRITYAEAALLHAEESKHDEYTMHEFDNYLLARAGITN